MKFEIKDLSIPAGNLDSEKPWEAQIGQCAVCTLTTPDDDDDCPPPTRPGCPPPTQPGCPPPTNPGVGVDGREPTILAHQDELNRLLHQPQS